jgi:hypothetical protein
MAAWWSPPDAPAVGRAHAAVADVPHLLHRVGKPAARQPRVAVAPAPQPRGAGRLRRAGGLDRVAAFEPHAIETQRPVIV